MAGRNLFNGIKPLVAFVLGGPGSGKGTQCKLICDEFGFKHLSAGDLLRAERNLSGSQYGEMIERHIKEGKIVPVEVTCSLLEKAMVEHCRVLATKPKDNGDSDNDLRGKFLIDGFPRNEDNLQGWTRQLADKVELLFVLFMECPLEVCLKRCLDRGLQGSNRSDDNEESIRKRLTTYMQDTMPIIEHYMKLNLVRTIDGTKSPEEVFSIVKKIFQ